jgi:hypothetical protein
MVTHTEYDEGCHACCVHHLHGEASHATFPMLSLASMAWHQQLEHWLDGTELPARAKNSPMLALECAVSSGTR